MQVDQIPASQPCDQATSSSEELTKRLISKGGAIVLGEDLTSSELARATDEGDVFVATDGTVLVRVDIDIMRTRLIDLEDHPVFDLPSELPAGSLLRALTLMDDEFEEFRTDFMVND